jgi:hypothetical protein
MDPQAVQEIEEKETEQRRNLLKLAQENPELLEQLEQMEPLMKALGDDPELIDVATQFAHNRT